MVFKLIQLIVLVAVGLLSSVRWVHYFQRQRYFISRYNKTLRANFVQILRKYGLISVLCAVIGWYLPILFSLFLSVEAFRSTLCNSIVLFVFCCAAVLPAIQEIQEASDTFRITLRVRRLLVMHGILYVLLILLLRLLHVSEYFMYALVPFVTWAAGRIMKPIEDNINRGFYNDAKTKLQSRKDLICIGITGSLGKTVTKFILADMLSHRYSVLMTPASYNTVMGVSQTINDMLEKKHNVFIAEMGAQYKGDVRTLVNLVRPKYGIITSICEQHIDTLGSVEGIMNAKQELVKGLPEDGEAFFAADSGYLDRLYKSCTHKKYQVAVDQTGDYAVLIHDVNYSSNGSRFYLSVKGEKEVMCRTRLMGRYMIQSVALAVSVCLSMGMTQDEIVKAIEQLKPIKGHLCPENRGYLFIDDRANRTQEGAADALDVLHSLPKRHVLVTCGFNMSNERDKDYNYAFGTQMVDCVDRLILVGPKGEVGPIMRGALKHLPRKAIEIVPNVQAAEALLNKTCGKGDAVLWEAPAE